jgi:hypothetical protein
MKKIFLRIGWTILIMAGIALFVATNHYDLIQLQEAVCYGCTDNLDLPIDSYVENYVGSSILDFPSSKYLDTIFETYPQIEAASISKNPFGKLVFNYSMKKPIILVNLDKVYGLTARGELVPAMGCIYPVVTGLRVDKPGLYKWLDGESVGYTLKIARLINADFENLLGRISTINLGHPSGLSVMLEGCSAELILGRGDEPGKFGMIETMSDFFHSLDDNIISVDFRFEDQLVLKKNN